MKWVTKEARFIAGTGGKSVCYGIIEDSGDHFAYVVYLPTKTHYIQQVRGFSLLTSEIEFSQYDGVDDDVLFNKLMKMFHNDLMLKSVIDKNKRAIDAGLIQHKAVDNAPNN